MTDALAATGAVTYLSTLAFDHGFLDRVRAVSPRVVVHQIPAERATDVPADLWATVDVLHTSTVLPDPGTAPRLRWVQLDTSGTDHLHGSPLWDSPVQVTTLGGVAPRALAEYVMVAVVGAAHQLPALLEARARRWWPEPAERLAALTPRSVAGATLAVVGYGRIGREIGRLAQAFGMKVVGVSRTGDPSTITEHHYGAPAAVEGDAAVVVGVDQLDDVLADADYLVVVVPLTPQTRGLIDAAAIARMKPGAVLVNVARGGIVDETALLAALREGRIAGAVLDVFDDEPLPADSPWWDAPGVIVTPHVAGLTPEYGTHVETLVCRNLQRFLDGQPLLNTVDRAKGY